MQGWEMLPPQFCSRERQFIGKNHHKILRIQKTDGQIAAFLIFSTSCHLQAIIAKIN